MADINQQAQEYYYLVQKGMAPAEAFKKVFPNGIPTAQERAKSAAGDQQKQAYGQLVGALGGLYGAKKLAEMDMPSFGSLFGGEASKEVAKEVGTEAAKEIAPEILSSGANAAADGGAYGVQTLSDGSTLMSDGSVVGTNSGALGTASTVLGSIAAAKGGYDALKGMQNGGEGTRAGLTTMGSGIGSILLPGVGTVAGAAMGNVAGYGLQGNGVKNDLALAALGPPGWGLLAAKKLGLTNHKTTGQRQQEAWGNIAKEGKASDFFFSSPVNQDQGVDDRKLASGELGGKDVWATSAFFNKFSKPGQTWDVTGTEAQREQVANEILANKLLDTTKGLTRFTDENAVQGIYDRIMGPKPQGGLQNLPVTKGPAMIDPAKLNLPAGQVSNLMPITPAPKGGLQTQVNPLVQALSRSRTASPGIDKNGKRIAY